MCNIFKCNRAGKYIGFYNNLSEAVYRNPNPQRDWFFTNGETLSVWMYNGSTWIDTNRGSSSSSGFEIIDDPATFIPSIVSGESKNFFYIAPKAGVYNFINFGVSLGVEYPCLIQLEWTGNSWNKYTYKITDPIKKQEYSLPNIEIRINNLPGVYSDPSEIYGAKEDTLIKSSYVEFRITESLDYINENKGNIYICLNRWRKKSENTQITRAWRVVTEKEHDTSLSYPNEGTGTSGYYQDLGLGVPFWTQSRIYPILLSNILPVNKTYNGEWIRYKFDMEYIMRRFIYCRKNQGENLFEVISPSNFFSTNDENIKLVKSGVRKIMSGKTGNPQYVTMTFGLCLGIKDFQVGSSYQHWIKSKIVPFTGILIKQKEGIYYNAKLYGKNKFVK